MLAILSALVGGVFVFSEAGFVAAAICAVIGYAVFVAYAYIRSGATVKNPVNRFHLMLGQAPPGAAIRLERFVSMILIPAGAAYLSFTVLF